MCALASATALIGAAAAPAGPATSGPRPNVVVVMTDDQTVGQLAVMPRTRQLIGEAGATFENSFVTFPLCCPSRASFLTGQYPHNHRVLGNAPPKGGFQSLRTEETLPVWLTRGGYFTGQIGKFMNGYKDSPVGIPPGWSEWHGEKSQDRYYGYQLYENGGPVTYGDPNENPEDPADPESYSTDVYTEKAINFIDAHAPAADPFFLWVSYNAPHSGQPDPPADVPSPCRGNAKPAERHLGSFADEPLPKPPSFNEPDVSDKPRFLRRAEPFDAAGAAAIERFYRCELASLLAVDEGVERIVGALGASGELDNTVLIFTSDNGFFHGEHRIPFGKNEIYEEAIRVPLLIRGPGIPAGTKISELVSNIDLSPTILAAAGARAGIPQDGRSLFPILARPDRERGREILLTGDGWTGIRTARYAYAEHHGRPENRGEKELYDLRRDPNQLRSQNGNRELRDVRRTLAGRLEELGECEGRECRSRPRLKLRRAGEGSCEGRSVTAEVFGPDAEELVRIEFRIRGRTLRTDRSQPWSAQLPRRRLERPGTKLEAVASFLDGRRVTLLRRIRCR